MKDTALHNSFYIGCQTYIQWSLQYVTPSILRSPDFKTTSFGNNVYDIYSINTCITLALCDHLQYVITFILI